MKDDDKKKFVPKIVGGNKSGKKEKELTAKQFIMLARPPNPHRYGLKHPSYYRTQRSHKGLMC